MRLLFLLVFLAPLVTQGQLRQRTEVGGGLGTMNYTGDIVRTYNPGFSRPAATLFYRVNFSQVVSLKTSITFGSIAGNDRRNPLDPAATKRNASFKSGIVEIAPVFEYHFIDWRDGRRHVRYTPYLFAGLGFFLFSNRLTYIPDPSIQVPFTTPPNYSRVQMSIPFGGGFKYVLNPNWYLGIEFGMRETFTDFLDGISSGNRKYKS